MTDAIEPRGPRFPVPDIPDGMIVFAYDNTPNSRIELIPRIAPVPYTDFMTFKQRNECFDKAEACLKTSHIRCVMARIFASAGPHGIVRFTRVNGAILQEPVDSGLRCWTSRHAGFDDTGFLPDINAPRFPYPTMADGEMFVSYERTTGGQNYKIPIPVSQATFITARQRALVFLTAEAYLNEKGTTGATIHVFLSTGSDGVIRFKYVNGNVFEEPVESCPWQWISKMS